MSTKKVSPWKKSLEKRHEDAGQGAQININLIKKLKSIRTEKSKNENTEQIYYEIEHKNKQISGKAKGNLKENKIKNQKGWRERIWDREMRLSQQAVGDGVLLPATLQLVAAARAGRKAHGDG
jgi:hypothetical protein